MTDEPNKIPENPPAPVPPRGGAAPQPNAPVESRAARSLTDRSPPRAGAEDHPSGETRLRPTAEHGPRVWPRVVGALILILGVGGAWVWQDPGSVERLTGLRLTDTAAGDAAFKALEARVAKLEQRPVSGDLTALTSRLDALEKRAAAQPRNDLGPLLARLDAIEARARDTSSAGQTTVPAPPSGEADLRSVQSRLETLERRIAEPAKPDAAEAFRARLDDLEHQYSGLAAKDASLTEVSARAMRLARLDAAAFALARGEKLGAIPDAPPALARFANTAPPTEAALRLAFPAAARAALKVSVPDTDGKPFADRVMARLQDFRLITVREGDRVLIGNSAADTLAHVQVLLDAGDLSGAIRAVSALSGPPAEKLAPWLGDAKALEAAREALAALAGNS